MKDNLSIDLNVSIVVSMICSIISAWFVYVLMLYVWNSVFKIIESSKIFNNITKNEKIIYAILLLVNIIFVIIVFNLTDGFYGTDYKYDFISYS